MLKVVPQVLLHDPHCESGAVLAVAAGARPEGSPTLAPVALPTAALVVAGRRPVPVQAGAGGRKVVQERGGLLTVGVGSGDQGDSDLIAQAGGVLLKQSVGGWFPGVESDGDVGEGVRDALPSINRRGAGRWCCSWFGGWHHDHAVTLTSWPNSATDAASWLSRSSLTARKVSDFS